MNYVPSAADLAQLRRKSNKKQTERTIFENCKKKYVQTKVLLESLEQKRKKLEDEISHLQQKQLDREKFMNETIQRHKKS